MSSRWHFGPLDFRPKSFESPVDQEQRTQHTSLKESFQVRNNTKGMFPTPETETQPKTHTSIWETFHHPWANDPETSPGVSQLHRRWDLCPCLQRSKFWGWGWPGRSNPWVAWWQLPFLHKQVRFYKFLWVLLGSSGIPKPIILGRQHGPNQWAHVCHVSPSSPHPTFNLGQLLGYRGLEERCCSTALTLKSFTPYAFSQLLWESRACSSHCDSYLVFFGSIFPKWREGSGYQNLPNCTWSLATTSKGSSPAATRVKEKSALRPKEATENLPNHKTKLNRIKPNQTSAFQKVNRSKFDRS